MRTNPQDKMCGNGKMEKRILHKYFEAYLPASVASAAEEQFSDGVGYSSIDTLKEVAAQQVSDGATGSCRFPLPVRHANL
ncbi:asparagine synthase-related protein [Shigella flexneri]